MILSSADFKRGGDDQFGIGQASIAGRFWKLLIHTTSSVTNHRVRTGPSTARISSDVADVKSTTMGKYYAPYLMRCKVFTSYV